MADTRMITEQTDRRGLSSEIQELSKREMADVTGGFSPLLEPVHHQLRPTTIQQPGIIGILVAL